MIRMTLAEVTHAVGGTLQLHGTDTPETVVSGTVDTDSREMGPGSVFVAKPGDATDGHLFVDAAVTAGASLAIVQRPVDAPVSQIVVPDAVAALGALAREVVARVRARGGLQVVGITGSNGKTTTKNLLARILQDERPTVAPRASFNNEVGAPVTMLRVTEDTRFLVSELGASRPGRIAELAGLITPDIGAVLMVGLAHAGRGRAFEALVLVDAVGGVVAGGELRAVDPGIAAQHHPAPAAGEVVGQVMRVIQIVRIDRENDRARHGTGGVKFAAARNPQGRHAHAAGICDLTGAPTGRARVAHG